MQAPSQILCLLAEHLQTNRKLYKLTQHVPEALVHIVRELSNLTTGAIFIEIKRRFAKTGIPKTLRCNNGIQFTSIMFQQLASQYGFEIVMYYSPHYPCGHRFVKSSSPDNEEVYLKVQRPGKTQIQPCWHTNNTPKSQYNIPSRTPKWSNFEIHTSWKDLLIKKPRRRAEGETRQPEPLLQPSQGEVIYVQDPERETWSSTEVVHTRK